MLPSAQRTKVAAAKFEIIADLVDFLNRLWYHITDMISLAVITISASTFKVILTRLQRERGKSQRKGEAKRLLFLKKG